MKRLLKESKGLSQIHTTKFKTAEFYSISKSDPPGFKQIRMRFLKNRKRKKNQRLNSLNNLINYLINNFDAFKKYVKQKMYNTYQLSFLQENLVF